MVIIENWLPDNFKWALENRTLCNIEGYLRPCQLRSCNLPPASTVPLADICIAKSEVVIVVEDDGDFRSEIIEMVKSQGYPVIGIASVKELQSIAEKYDAGCILLDIRLPGLDGLSAQDWLNSINSSMSVVFMSGVRDIATIVQCMKAGAVEFLSKPFGEISLRRAVDMAIGVSRQRYCTKQSRNLVRQLISRLTPTEMVVANLMARGYLTKAIATELGRSENTIKIHRHRIFNKLRINSAASVGNIIRHAQLMP